MNGRKITILIAYLLVCVLTVLLCYKLGRGKEQIAESRDEPRRRERARKSPNGLQRMTAAAEPRFGTRGEASTEDVKKRFADAVTKSRVMIDARALLLAAELRADEFPEAAEMVASLPDPGRTQLLNMVLARWAEFEPEKAAAFTLALPGQHDVRKGLESIFQSWGHKDPRGGLRWFQELLASGRYPPRVGIRSSLMSLFYSWAQDDPKAAIAAAEEIQASGGSNYPLMGIGALAAVEEFRPQALDAAEAMRDEKKRLKTVERIVGGWAGNDPQAAAAWLDEGGYLDAGTERAVSKGYGNRDPVANIEWISRRAPEERRGDAVANALNYWALNDVVSAAAWLEGKGPSERCIPIIARCYSTVDLDKAMEWATRASEENLDGVIAETLATAWIRDSGVDITTYLDAGSLSAEEMTKKVEETTAKLGGQMN